MPTDTSSAPVRITHQERRSRLHVLTLTPFFPSRQNEVGGCFVAESLRELESREVSSSVIAVSSVYHPARHAGPNYPCEWKRYLQFPGNFGLASAGKLLGRKLLHSAKQLHQRLPIHVIHAHAALPCGDAAKFIADQLNIPFVVTIHGLDVFNRCFETGMASKWRRKVSAEVYRAAASVICISESVRGRFVDEMGLSLPVQVVYNGTDCSLFRPGPACEAANTILIVGNLLAGKGHELVLRAMAELKQSYRSLCCNVIGEGADRERFAQVADNLGIRENVHFLGRRNRAEVAEAMRECTLFALPSRNEGLGCVYLEAMACGKPVIGCQGQGIANIIDHGKNGWLIPVDGLSELTEGLRLLLSDPCLRNRVGEAARETILSNFSLSHQAAQLREIYEAAAR